MSKTVKQGLVALLLARAAKQKRPSGLSLRVKRRLQQQALKLSKDLLVQHHFNALQDALDSAAKMPWSKVQNNIMQEKAEICFDANTANIMAGQAVDQAIMVHGDVAGVVFHAFFLSAEDAFEEFDVDYANLRIKATAVKAENVRVTLVGYKPLSSGYVQSVKVKIKLAIIPDPKTLWKNLPSDHSARFHKPDADAKILSNKTVTVAAGSLRGRAHAHKGTHRDDDFHVKLQDGGWQVLAVADGAGSCKWSRRGAQLAVQKSVETLSDALNGTAGPDLLAAYKDCLSEETGANLKKLQESYRETIVKAVHEAVLSIQQEAANVTEDSVKDFSTTLLLSAVKPLADGYVVLSFWVGDGAIALLYDEQLMLMGEADAGQYAGQTRFLTPKIIESGDVYQRVRIKKIKTLKGLILATDGVTDPYFETDASLKRLDSWEKLYQEISTFPRLEPKESDKIIDWLGFWSPGNHDDRTFALLVPAPIPPLKSAQTASTTVKERT